MDYYNDINNERNIFLTKLFEPEENSLELELTIGMVGDLENSSNDFEVNIGPYRPIYYDESSKVYRVSFEHYIAYTVLNESYESLGGEVYEGDKIRSYQQSNFLDYVRADTFATADYPGAFTHYAFVSLNHIVNVAAMAAPRIEKLN